MSRTTTIFAAALIAGSAFATMARAEDGSSSFDQRLGNGNGYRTGGGFISRSVSMQRQPAQRTMNRASQVREGGAK